MTELNKVFESYWLSRIDKHRHTPRVNFGVGAVDKIGELAKEIAKNTKCIIITDKSLRKIGLIERPKNVLFNMRIKIK